MTTTQPPFNNNPSCTNGAGTEKLLLAPESDKSIDSTRDFRGRYGYAHFHGRCGFRASVNGLTCRPQLCSICTMCGGIYESLCYLCRVLGSHRHLRFRLWSTLVEVQFAMEDL